MPIFLPSTAEQESQQILICGAGIGGLALAQGLQKAQIPFRVFERDPSPDFRPQGYRLKLNAESCNSLKSVLPDHLWQKFAACCCLGEAGETDFNAIDGSILSSRPGMGLARGPPPMTTDRAVLRSILLSGVEKHITFGKELSKYEETANGVRLYFTDETSIEGALLVGADGVRSRVRKQYLPNHRPVDTEGACVYGKTPITPELIERFPKRAMRWMTLCVDRTPITHSLDVDDRPLTLLLEPIRFPDGPEREGLPRDYVYWVLISRKESFGQTPEDLERLLKLTCKESAALSLHMTQEWDEGIRSLLELQDIAQSSTLRVCSANPDMSAWEPSERITLLGDSIHVMSPCGGVGAATALNDGAALAHIIAAEGVSKSTIGAYEESMRTRAKLAIERSYFGGKKMFAQKPFAQCQPIET